MSGFRHEVQPLILIRNLTTYTPNADGLKACENAYILVGFIFRLVENSPRKCSQQTVVMQRKFKNIYYIFKISPCSACKHAFEAFKIYSYKIRHCPLILRPRFTDTVYKNGCR